MIVQKCVICGFLILDGAAVSMEVAGGKICGPYHRKCYSKKLKEKLKQLGVKHE